MEQTRILYVESPDGTEKEGIPEVPFFPVRKLLFSFEDYMEQTRISHVKSPDGTEKEGIPEVSERNLRACRHLAGMLPRFGGIPLTPAAVIMTPFSGKRATWESPV